MKLSGTWKRIIVVGGDVFLTAFAYWFAYVLRFNFSVPAIFYQKFVESVLVLIVLRLASFYWFGLYSGIWRYASISDLARILKAVTLSSFLFVAYETFFFRLADFSRSVFIIDWCIITICVGGSRFLYRLSREFSFMKNKNGKKVIIIGAGDAGEMLLREIRQNPALDYDIVGFLDNGPSRKGMRIHDVSVLGGIDDLAKIGMKEGADQVIVAIPTITGGELRGIKEQCDAAGMVCKTLPAISDILKGKITVNQIREISIEDLLGREHIELNRDQIRDYLYGKRVLVTGAAGSIGLELCRQIVKVEPEHLVLFERVENELYNVELEFSETFPHGSHVFVLGDILDVAKVERVMETYKPQVVFHAAAYKHVPMMEAHPFEAIRNNIQGTLNVAEASAKYGVEKFVLISTDKAVEPANIMGATKRIAELICQGMNQLQSTKFIAVRFGNVLNSAGSVIPLFKRQIMKGGPVTVTHPDMTRYFMSIPEAAQLVMQAGAIGRGGEIFVLDMGEPVKIVDLARDMIRLMGLKVGEDIDITYSGLRPGEKIHEELVSREEEVESRPHEKIMMVKTTRVDWVELKQGVGELLREINGNGVEEIRRLLFLLIPESSGPR
ncbi:MAG TPA: nucleoside-diphosphate sugar epimerase/dehydratase [Syntrophorhabdaceae bacterium]|nr:nucleoside-diphosphate sugar epimerase/dehydratase [Syntrophorhabdaceae bacterium]